MGNTAAKPEAPRALSFPFACVGRPAPFAGAGRPLVLFDLDQTLIAACEGATLAAAETYSAARTPAAPYTVLRSSEAGAVAFAVRPRACATLREVARVAAVGVWSRGAPAYVRLLVEVFVEPALSGRLRDPDDAPLPRAILNRRGVACVLDRSHCERAMAQFGNHKDLRFAASHLGVSPSAVFIVEDQPDNAPWTQSQRVVWVRPFVLPTPDPDPDPDRETGRSAAEREREQEQEEREEEAREMSAVASALRLMISSRP